MSGLSGSRWASKVSGESPTKDSRPRDEIKHVSVPNFGFQTPAFTPTKPSPLRQAQAPPADRDQTPTPATASKPSSATKIAQDPPTKPGLAPEQRLTKAEIAAAATRARMAEIMGPRRHQGLSSAVKGTTIAGLNQPEHDAETSTGSGGKSKTEMQDLLA